ncbi:MAG: UDP-N-acetylmuramoyl-L-alanyl-D-glutamate--2,6-diaminopimelate ligase, partial [Thermomicrobiales bacterium]|nr:UDP-N-acetylmuramoyl-L-alanyl-D-glutamate--2,6-diaminopimelate ligase [Thermomicrobiales bacterium]
GTRFTLWLPGLSLPIVLPLLGTFNVANALCAAAITHAAGVPPAEIVAGLQAAPPIPGLLTPVDAGQPFLVLIDEAKSAVALVTTLEAARQRRPEGRLIAVVSGSDVAQPGVLAQCGEIATLAADFTVFTTRRARFADPAALLARLATGARAAGGREDLTFVCEADRRAAITHALSLAQPGDCVLLTGKGIEDTLIVGNDVRPWDEAVVAREILAELGYGATHEPEASDA